MARPRARIWILSVAAVLLPAAGIAYLGAQAYGGERGAVAQRIGHQQAAARELAAWLEAELARTLAAVEAAPDTPADGLATFRFRIDGDGELVVPDPTPFGAVTDPEISGPTSAPCGDRGLEACIREARTQEQRSRQLVRARVDEVAPCGEPSRVTTTCASMRGEARRLYGALAAFDDTGPDALLGLARLARAAGDKPAARAALDALAARFADRDVDGAPVALLAALGTAELDDDPTALLAVYRWVLVGVYPASAAALDAALARIGDGLDRRPLDPGQAELRATLDAEQDAARRAARVAAGLAPDVDEVFRAAGAEPHGRIAARAAERTLVFRRAADGGVVGVAVDAAMLQAALPAPALDGIAPAARALVLPVGRAPAATLRSLAQVPIGAALPHLTLAVVNLTTDPDPLDDVIRGRARRHVVLTTGLALVLVVGLLATIRGAARERELSRLKSDFVSTVSHELKTPLTSIRMFAEMLQQGVAAGDADRTARYHGVIVKESQRLGLLIANLLDYAQIERGTRRYTVRRERVAEVATTAVETFAQLANPTVPEMRIAIAPAAADAHAQVDRDVIIQALLNLLANASKYGGGTAIDVAVDATADTATIAVTDRGPGIPDTEHDRIFREFYRAPAAYSSNVEGTGLGLALVKRHVEAQGGQVAVESTVGRGATFTIALPIDAAGDDAGGEVIA
jgi:two-component system phosphate regulon sensor histidine kinase PhoR